MSNPPVDEARGDDWTVLRPFPERPALREDEVHVVRWHRPSAGTVTDGGAVLDAADRERLAGLLRERDRRGFVAVRLFLRLVLAACVGRPPEALRFTTNAFGKPSLASPPTDVSFNLSHAGALVLVAVARGREVGVDIEHERPTEVLSRSGRFFSGSEHAALQRCAPAIQRVAFFRCWTRKEAFIKALGRGMAFPLKGFDVSLDDGDEGPVLRACPAAPDELSRWRIVPLPIDSGYAAAVAAAGQAWRVVRWNAPAALRPPAWPAGPSV